MLKIDDQLDFISNILGELGVGHSFILEKGGDLRDIDILVKRRDLGLITERIICEESNKGYRLVKFIKESYTTQLYFYSRSTGASFNIDLMPEVSFRGVPYFSESILVEPITTVIAGVRVLSQTYYFAYKVIRDLLQRGVIESSLKEQIELLPGDKKQTIHQLVNQVFGGIDSYFQNGVSSRKIRAEFFFNMLMKSPLSTLKGLVDNIAHKLKRNFYYPGLMIAVLGPDGAGKSSVITEISNNSVIGPSKKYYLLPGWLSRYKTKDGDESVIVTDPHKRNNRSLIFSVAKMFIFLFEYVIGFLSIVLVDVRVGKLVIFDRYFSDMVVDPKRYRYGGPSWLVSVVDKVVPSPDITILLVASAEVIQTRKQEVSFAETERQLIAYRKYTAQLANGHIVDTDRPLIEVVSEVNNIIEDYLTRRAEKRYANSIKP